MMMLPSQQNSTSLFHSPVSRLMSRFRLPSCMSGNKDTLSTASDFSKDSQRKGYSNYRQAQHSLGAMQAECLNQIRRGSAEQVQTPPENDIIESTPMNYSPTPTTELNPRMLVVPAKRMSLTKKHVMMNPLYSEDSTEDTLYQASALQEVEDQDNVTTNNGRWNRSAGDNTDIFWSERRPSFKEVYWEETDNTPCHTPCYKPCPNVDNKLVSLATNERNQNTLVPHDHTEDNNNGCQVPSSGFGNSSAYASYSSLRLPHNHNNNHNHVNCNTTDGNNKTSTNSAAQSCAPSLRLPHVTGGHQHSYNNTMTSLYAINRHYMRSRTPQPINDLFPSPNEKPCDKLINATTTTSTATRDVHVPNRMRKTEADLTEGKTEFASERALQENITLEDFTGNCARVNDTVPLPLDIVTEPQWRQRPSIDANDMPRNTPEMTEENIWKCRSDNSDDMIESLSQCNDHQDYAFEEIAREHQVSTDFNNENSEIVQCNKTVTLNQYANNSTDVNDNEDKENNTTDTEEVSQLYNSEPAAETCTQVLNEAVNESGEHTAVIDGVHGGASDDTRLVHSHYSVNIATADYDNTCPYTRQLPTTTTTMIDSESDDDASSCITDLQDLDAFLDSQSNTRSQTTERNLPWHLISLFEPPQSRNNTSASTPQNGQYCMFPDQDTEEFVQETFDHILDHTALSLQINDDQQSDYLEPPSVIFSLDDETPVLQDNQYIYDGRLGATFRPAMLPAQLSLYYPLEAVLSIAGTIHRPPSYSDISVHDAADENTAATREAPPTYEQALQSSAENGGIGTVFENPTEPLPHCCPENASQISDPPSYTQETCASQGLQETSEPRRIWNTISNIRGYETNSSVWHSRGHLPVRWNRRTWGDYLRLATHQLDAYPTTVT